MSLNPGHEWLETTPFRPSLKHFQHMRHLSLVEKLRFIRLATGQHSAGSPRLPFYKRVPLPFWSCGARVGKHNADVWYAANTNIHTVDSTTNTNQMICMERIKLFALNCSGLSNQKKSWCLVGFALKPKSSKPGVSTCHHQQNMGRQTNQQATCTALTIPS